MKKLFFCAIIVLALLGCMTDNVEAKRILESEGYTNIKFTGYKCFACSDDDFYSTGFTATSIAGKQVNGTVCGGIMKGYTIRID